MSKDDEHDDDAAAPPLKPTDPLRDVGLDLPPVDAVTALLMVGRNIELPLSPRKQDFKVGSAQPPEVDITVRSLRSPDVEHVSRVHVMIYRKHNHLWLVDQRSTSGLWIDDRRELAAERRAGQSFRVGDVTLLCLDEALRLLRPGLHWHLGLSAFDLVDHTLEILSDGKPMPLVLIAPLGSEPRALAEAIHQGSGRSALPFIELDPALTGRPEQTAFLAMASGSTVYVDLTRITKLSAYFVAELFGSTFHVRPIFVAPSLEIAAERLTERYLVRVQVHAIPPMPERRDDIPRLFNTIMRQGGSDVTLDADAAARLSVYPWPSHLAEMRKVEPDVRSYLENGRKLRPAARALGKSHGALRRTLERLGLLDPARDGDERDDDE